MVFERGLGHTLEGDGERLSGTSDSFIHGASEDVRAKERTDGSPVMEQAQRALRLKQMLEEARLDGRVALDATIQPLDGSGKRWRGHLFRSPASEERNRLKIRMQTFGGSDSTLSHNRACGENSRPKPISSHVNNNLVAARELIV
jgi:hypothetical protein